MTPSLILVLATAAASALMTLVLVVLFFVFIPRFVRAGTPWQSKAHDALLLAAYALFPVQVLTNGAAFGGTFGDGATSMFRSVTPFTLVAVPCIQIGLFAVWLYLRLTRFRGTRCAGAFVAAAPAAVPASYVVLWAGMWYHWF
jgi:hypothetical protein